MFKSTLPVTILSILAGCSSDSDVGSVQFKLSDPTADVVITIDGVARQGAELNKPLELSTGEHELIVEGEGYESFREGFLVEGGSNPVHLIQLIPILTDIETVEETIEVNDTSPAPNNDAPKLDAPKVDAPEHGDSKEANVPEIEFPDKSGEGSNQAASPPEKVEKKDAK